jgi:hypothetical protein
MPLIPAPPAAPDRDAVPLRLDRDVHDQLRAYAEFLGNGTTKEYIVTAALQRVFRQDKEFIAWQHARRSESASTEERAEMQTTATSNSHSQPLETRAAETPRRPAGGR